MTGSKYRDIYYIFIGMVILMTSSIIPRAEFLTNFVTSSDTLDFPDDYYGSPRNIQRRCNDILDDDAVILSLFSGERYFSNHPVICSRTYPYSRRIFNASTLREELDILRDLAVTHVYFNPHDPMEMRLHGRNYWNPPPDRPDPADDLRLLNSIGQLPGLEEVLSEGRFTLYRVCYEDE